MTTTRIEEGEWLRYFDRAKATLCGRMVSVQLVAEDVGAQYVAERLGLVGITYDPKDRLLDVALEGLDHLIERPREIYVDEAPDGAIAIEAIDAEGRKHIIRIGIP